MNTDRYYIGQRVLHDGIEICTVTYQLSVGQEREDIRLMRHTGDVFVASRSEVKALPNDQL